MVRLNLVPEKVRAAAALFVVMMLGVAVYAVVALIAGWYFVVLQGNLTKVNKQVADVRIELSSPALQETVKEVAKFRAQETELKIKSEQVNVLRKRQVYLARLLDVIPDLLPPRVWLTRIDQSDDGKGGRRVLLEGFAAGPESLGEFISNLESNGLVTKLRMDDSPTKAIQFFRDVVKYRLSFVFEEQL